MITPITNVGYETDFKKIVILLLMVGMLMIFIGYQQEKSLSPFPHVLYKYIPKSYYDEMFSQIPIISTFTKLFNNASPWEEAKPGYDQYNDIYSYNHFTKKGEYNFFDHQDSYYEY